VERQREFGLESSRRPGPVQFVSYRATSPAHSVISMFADDVDDA
jgi:hypothetical protein